MKSQSKKRDEHRLERDVIQTQYSAFIVNQICIAEVISVYFYVQLPIFHTEKVGGIWGCGIVLHGRRLLGLIFQYGIYLGAE